MGKEQTLQARRRIASADDRRAALARATARLRPSAASAPVVSAYLRHSPLAGRFVAALLLLAALPLIALLALLVRLTSRGPAFYRQTRVGKDGRRFVLHKIRTMVDGAEKDTGPTWTRAEDPRITAVGRVLRRRHLDELPQLLNVVRGEMSIVGPRPERPEFVPVLAAEIPGYLERLAVAPGLIGLAQIHLPPDVDVASVREKLALDLTYVRTASFSMDARIFSWASLRLLGVPFLTAIAWTKLTRAEDSGAAGRSADDSRGLWPRSPAAPRRAAADRG